MYHRDKIDQRAIQKELEKLNPEDDSCGFNKMILDVPFNDDITDKDGKFKTAKSVDLQNFKKPYDDHIGYISIKESDDIQMSHTILQQNLKSNNKQNAMSLKWSNRLMMTNLYQKKKSELFKSQLSYLGSSMAVSADNLGVLSEFQANKALGVNVQGLDQLRDLKVYPNDNNYHSVRSG